MSYATEYEQLRLRADKTEAELRAEIERLKASRELLMVQANSTLLDLTKRAELTGAQAALDTGPKSSAKLISLEQARELVDRVIETCAAECSTKCNEGCESRIDTLDTTALLAEAFK